MPNTKKKNYSPWSIIISDSFVAWEYPCEIDSKMSIEKVKFAIKKALGKKVRRFGLPRMVKVEEL